MKTIKFLQTAILVILIAAAASCSTSRRLPAERYPEEDRRIITGRYPEEDRRVVIVNDPYPQNLPPGQAKKIYGGRSARTYAPGQRKKQYDYPYRRVPLIIYRTPGIIIGRNNDGRYYHRNNEGFLYWQGYDNRFYIDDEYISQIRYDEDEYKDWRLKGRKSNGNNNDNGRDNRQHDNGKGKGRGHRHH